MDGIRKVLWPDGGTGNPTSAFSGIAFEEDDVPIREKILLAFEPELAGVARLLHGTRCDQVVVGDYLGLDEGVLEISVDDPGALGGGHSLAEGPGPGFLFPRGKKAGQSEQVVGSLDEGAHARVGDPHGFQVFEGILIGQLR